MRFLAVFITRSAIIVLVTARLGAQATAPQPSYRVSANGEAPGIPVEVIANAFNG